MSDSDSENISLDEEAKHEAWLEGGREDLDEIVGNLRDKGGLLITQTRLMMLTLEPSLWKIIHEVIEELPTGTIQTLDVDFPPSEWVSLQDYRNPPDDEALMATAMQLAELVSSSIERLHFSDAAAFMTPSFLAKFPCLRSLTL